MTKRNYKILRSERPRLEGISLLQLSVCVQRMLNEVEKEKVKVFKKLIPSSVLRTYDSIDSIYENLHTKNRKKIINVSHYWKSGISPIILFN